MQRGSSRVLLLAAATLLLSLHIVSAAHAHAEGSNSRNCTAQHHDVYYKFVVGQSICNFFRPADVKMRGPAAGAPEQWTECIHVNGTTPGPPIRAKLGDWVRIDVVSALPSRLITLHWHGLSMTDTPWADGSSRVNACPIMPGNTVTYLWRATEAGTFYYHGHHGLEIEYGLYGSIIIDDPSDPTKELYDEELPFGPIHVNDWWRNPDGRAANAREFRFYQDLDLALINGIYGNGTQLLPYTVMNVAPSRCYRMRFINGNTEWTGWTTRVVDALTGAPVRLLLTAWGTQYLRPTHVDAFSFYNSQRVDAVLCTPGAATDLNITFSTAYAENGTCTGRPGCKDSISAIIRVGGLNSTGASKVDMTRNAAFPAVPLMDPIETPETIVPYKPVEVPPKPSQTWVIKVGIFPTPPPRSIMYAWTERQWVMQMPRAPPLFTGAKCGTERAPSPDLSALGGRSAYLFKSVKKGEVVDIIFDNVSPFMHPMHVHGHEFTVLGSKFYAKYGYGARVKDLCPEGFQYSGAVWDPPAAPPVDTPFAFGCIYNASLAGPSMLKEPFRTDVVVVPAHGWSYTRVRFDNPGVWYLHCHKFVHMHRGMGFMVHVALDKVPKIPAWVDTSCALPCRTTNQYCGDYSPPRGQVPRCSRDPQNTCPLTSPDDGSYIG